MTQTKIRLGTRGSMLARMQSGLVADDLERAHRGLRVELVIVKTSGDAARDRPLRDLGGKGLFVKELEEALLAGQIDLAVHSFKDVPSGPGHESLAVAAVPARQDVRDALVRRPGAPFKTLADLPPGATVGTGSLRRMCQIAQRRPDLKWLAVRGNIDTRLRKLAAGPCEALILAMAGLRRTALFDGAAMEPIDVAELLPAAGQGALALQCRRDDSSLRQLLNSLDDVPTALCVTAERALVARLSGDCHSPIAALAVLGGKAGDTLHLRCVVGSRDGKPPLIRAEATADKSRSQEAVDAVYRALCDMKVHQLLGDDVAS